MKETTFIERNKDKWSKFESMYASQKKDPEELSALYMDMTEDLSYARTFYKRRTVRVYLNQLGQQVFSGVHKNKGESLSKLLTVWRVSLPLEIYRARKVILFTFLVFLLYAAIGVITTYFNPDFPRIVMGDGYVEMTIENIQNGNPLKVYEDENQFTMFVNIATNNLKVAFLTFILGFFFTVGTHILLFQNGVMLGAFQYFFHTKGLLATTFLGIWIHGAFEISAIVLAGAAGITAGNGLLFPGSYTRMQSLQIATKRGMKIMLSLVPFIILAGFLESFVTHNYQELADWSKWFIIFLSFGIILFYYVLYPQFVARKYPHLVNDEEPVVLQVQKEVQWYKIRSVGEAIVDTFRTLRNYFTAIFTPIAGLVIPIAGLLIYFQDKGHMEMMRAVHWFDWQAHLSIIFGFRMENGGDFLTLFVWSILIALIASSVFHAIKYEGQFGWSTFLRYVKSRIVGIWLANLLLFSAIFFLPWYWLVVFVFILPMFAIVNVAVAGLHDSGFGKRMRLGFSMNMKMYGTNLLSILILSVLVFLFSQLIASVFSQHGWNDEPMIPDLLDMLAQFVGRIAQNFTEDYTVVSNIARQIVYLLFTLLVFPMFFLLLAFNYFSVVEREESIGLKKAFEKFGKRNRTQESSVDFE